MTPLRIIMLSYERGFLDPQSEASRRLMRLASDDVRITAIVLSHAGSTVGEDGGMVRTVAIKGSAPVRFWRAFWMAIAEARRAKKAGERVLVTAQDPFIAGKIAFYVSRFMNVPYEIQEHADYFSGGWVRERPWVHSFAARAGLFFLRRADAVRVVSGRIKDRLIRKGISAERITVAPVVQDVSSLLARPMSADLSATPTIVAPCRFVKQKGLDILLRAFATLAKEGVAFRVRLIGEGSEGPALADLASQLGIRDRVEFEPWSSAENIWNDADLFVLSSNYEGWGRTIIEAMAAGVPIVTTDVGCVGSFFRPQLDGRVVQSGDVNGLASAIREQLTENDRRNWMAVSARARIKDLPMADDLIAQQRDAWHKTLRPYVPTSLHPASIHPQHDAWKITFAIIAFAILIHGLAVFLFGNSIASNREWGFFTLVEHWFQGFGYSFASQAGCVSAYRSPGFLFFLTAVYGLFGFPNFFAQVVIQNILAVVLTYLVYRLGWRASGDRRVGWIAALLVTLHPYTFYHYTQYYHTVLSGLFLVSLLLCLLALERTKRLRWAWIAGVMTAALAYIQGTILPAMPFLALWVVWRGVRGTGRVRPFVLSSLRPYILYVCIIALTSLTLIAPWTYRNWKVFHQFIPLTTDMGHAFAKANNENMLGLALLGFPQESYMGDTIINPQNPRQVRYIPVPEAEQALRDRGWFKEDAVALTQWHPRESGMRWPTCADIPTPEPAFNDYWSARGMEWLQQNYWSEGWELQLVKMTQFWSPFLQPSQKYGAPWSFGDNAVLVAAVRWSLAAYVFLLELFAIAGLVMARRRQKLWMVIPLLIPLVIYTILHSFFAGYTKYRIPLDNLLAVLAAIAVIALWDRVRKKKS